ncbi:Proteasome subunit beta type-2-a-like protein, partial [Quillaja saponaria]
MNLNSREDIQKSMALYYFHKIPLTTSVASSFTRGEHATALRKRQTLRQHHFSSKSNIVDHDFLILASSWPLPTSLED